MAVYRETARKALVVDDDPAIRRLLRLALAPYGFTVDEAEDGQEALAMIAMERFDVLIVDLEMPVMSGWSLLEQVDGELPVFVLSVHNARRAAQHAHARGWMRKPFDPDALGEAVSAAAGGR